jgi:hypothetical protein
LPFELARRFGNFRLDHTCLSLRMSEDDASVQWSLVCAGEFSPVGVAAAFGELQLEGGQSRVEAGTAHLAWTGGAATVTSTLLRVHSGKAPVPCDPVLASKLLTASTACLHAHVPTGSKLSVMAAEAGFVDANGCDVALEFGDPAVLTATVQAKDEAAARQLATTLKDQLLELGIAGVLARMAIEFDDSVLRCEPKGTAVHVHAALPKRLQVTLEKVRQLTLGLLR